MFNDELVSICILLPHNIIIDCVLGFNFPNVGTFLMAIGNGEKVEYYVNRPCGNAGRRRVTAAELSGRLHYSHLVGHVPDSSVIS